jgi:pimeloyl-ACP methyl ester carboxylesterase
MSEAETRYLQVNGAKLCFDVVGSGPHILFVAGANGDAGIFYPIREQLRNYFTVVTYDRRGFSRSELIGDQDYTNRIDTDVDDIYQMMKSLTNEKFVIFGNSSGAVVSLRYLVTHPETLSKALIHEPPLLAICPEKEEYRQYQYDIYNVYKTEGKDAALVKFADFYCNEEDKYLMQHSQGDTSLRTNKNSDYWFEYELRQYTLTEFDWEKVKACKDKLIPIVGILNKGFFLYKPITHLANLTGTELFEISGSHLGFLTATQPFAEELIERLKKEKIIQ